MRAAISMAPVRCAGLVRSTGASGDGGGAALAASTVEILAPVPRRFVFRLFNQDTVALPHIARLLGMISRDCADFTCSGWMLFGWCLQWFLSNFRVAIPAEFFSCRRLG